MIIVNINNIITLQAENNKIIADLNGKIIGEFVYLGCDCLPTDYQEIDKPIENETEKN